MISAWWLLLIIPISVYFGFFLNAILQQSKENWNDKDKK